MAPRSPGSTATARCCIGTTTSSALISPFASRPPMPGASSTARRCTEPMLPDAGKVGRIIAEIAAAEIMPYFEKLEHGDISEKKPGDLVTVADLAAERALTAALTGLAPGSIAVGEEAVAADPGAIGALKGDAPVWIIDPIDGTVNFASGNPVFAVMVALFTGSETVMSWIYDPVKQLMATAGRGEGAWQGGRRLAVAHSASPTGARLGNRPLARRLPDSSRFIDVVFDYRCA